MAREDLVSPRRRTTTPRPADVERLEGFGLTRGARCRAGHAHGRARPRARGGGRRPVCRCRAATARLQAVESRREDVDRRLAQLGDTAARREAAAEAHATAVRASGGPRPRRLDAVLDELAAVQAQVAELAEAREAGIRAATALDARPRRAGLGRLVVGLRHLVRRWPGSSAIKHDRIDAAGTAHRAGPGGPGRPGPRARRRRERGRAAGRPRHLPHDADLRRVVRQPLQRPVGALEHPGQRVAGRHGRRRRARGDARG